ncbi:MAG TPA: indole-3-glycerol phosphate synthase TrpC [Acidimicrobiales bacterium]|nr:indole-3-glycerol phosphate synthase TrpC [Acidimicrobiales bacterium]
MATSYLDKIVAWHRQRAAEDGREWRDRLGPVNQGRPSFRRALERQARDPVAVIGELKRRSPSKGWLAPDLDVVAMARRYRDAGVAAISILTDHEFFSGTLSDLEAVSNHVSAPLLRKDFTVSENDVLDARDAGASAVLLITTALSDDELERFLALAREVGLDALVEVHDRDEASRALASGATLIGVNQRDLRTFEVNPSHAASVVDAIRREGIVTVCESAIATVADVQRAADAGYDAVLVGEAFVTAVDPDVTVRSFASIRPLP